MLVEAVESEAGKLKGASDAWSNPNMPGAVGIKSKLIVNKRPPSRTSSPLSDEGHAEFGEACPRYAAHGRRKTMNEAAARYNPIAL